MIRVSIVGATGLVGECLLRTLLGHPECRIAMLVSDHAAGKPIGDLLPALRGDCDLTTVTATPAEIAKASDVVLIAKKGSESFAIVPGLLKGGAKVITMGGEFRFRDAAVYEKWYKEPHGNKELLEKAVYGLPELFREEIRGAKLVGNPGCYVTSAILALAPFVAEGLVEDDGLIIDSYSGLSGAGRQYSEKQPNLFVDIESNLRAYKVGTHQHTPEIEMGLAHVAQRPLKVTFVPHLAPLDRGILTTVFARPKKGAQLTQEQAHTALRQFYGNGQAKAGSRSAKAGAIRGPFVRVLDQVEQVSVSNVLRSNYCDVAVQLVERTGQLVVASALDNLVKGAAGQAIQNLNLMCGLDETLGLKGRSL